MADAAGLLLLEQVGDDAVVEIEVLVDIHLAHVVDKIEIEVPRTGLLELLLEDLLDLVHVRQVVTGKLGGEVEGVARMAGERGTHRDLGIAAMIAPRGVEVVDALLQRVVDHLVDRGLVDLGVIAVDNRQAHRAKAERGQLHALKVLVQHLFSPLYACTTRKTAAHGAALRVW